MVLNFSYYTYQAAAEEEFVFEIRKIQFGSTKSIVYFSLQVNG